jgi:predicted DNA binding CopG/RHH family protein
MSKKVSIAPRPSGRQADEWVNAPAKAAAPAAGQEMKRLTIDIPASLHRRVKAVCAAEGVKMADVVRELLAKKYG